MRRLLPFLIALLLLPIRSDSMQMIGFGAGGGGTENIGYEEVGDTSGYQGNADVKCSALDTAGHTGTITSIYIYSINEDAGQDVYLGVYTDSGGVPNTLVENQEFTNIGTWAEGWHQFTGLSISVTASNSYWLCWQYSIDAVTTHFWYDTFGTRYVDYSATYGNWNSPFVNDSSTTATYSIYGVIEY
jgi:hypothetical protein